MPRASRSANPARQPGARKGSATAGRSSAQAARAAKSRAAAPAAKTGRSGGRSPQARGATVATGGRTGRKADASGTRSERGRAAGAPGRAQRGGATKAPKARRKVTDKFLLEQEGLLLAERATYLEQAEALKAEADSLAQEMEPGDVQFDEESGEGGTVTVDRERDLALSAQARAAVEDIDHALAKIEAGTYGLCEGCGQPIPRARLKALPQARLCVTCKSGGLSRR